jgi:hypothetical protein
MSATNRSLRFSTLAAGAIAVGISAYAIVVTPSSHDYGNVAVGGIVPFEFNFTRPGGAAVKDSMVSVEITGADPADFYVAVDCGERPYAPCPVSFRPKSFGPKQARLVVKDLSGATAIALLKGKGVRAICEPIVVFCNYAFLYDGTFSWSHVITGPYSKTTIEVTVAILHGRGTCNGSETVAGGGQSTTGGITGTGLVAVEFVTEPLKDTSRKAEPVYRITVACPTPAYPKTDDSEATPSQPAELGHNDQTTYNIKGVPIGSDLIGTISYPAPETDGVNGIGGNVTVTWRLTYSTNAMPSIISSSIRKRLPYIGSS